MEKSAYDILKHYMPTFPRKHAGKIITNTTEFMSIDYGDVMYLDGKHYLVNKNLSERRFGLEDPKYWVKRCKELETGKHQIIKLEFYEKFDISIGTIRSSCYRSPRKESRILKLVDGDMRFMQGKTVLDEKGNCVRILDIIYGSELDVALDHLSVSHEEYFNTIFPDYFAKFIGAVKAIAHLHLNHEQHGDIRRDHLLIESDTKNWRWIDFDYAFGLRENPFALDLFGLGSILLLLVGQREITAQQIGTLEQSQTEVVTAEDMALAMPYRLANIQKRYPYIPDTLNNICMHFSAKNSVFYSSVTEFVSALLTCFHELPVFKSARRRYPEV
ncbi:serine/threonine protein kinase [Halodesulfovibrio aestuarii]|uniref:Serine/threonine protein kinase n=1 Tax=Halodesulfovibrio aestuarii TaxID=126333 RepID=A0ABV4JTD0_9BACT